MKLRGLCLILFVWGYALTANETVASNNESLLLKIKAFKASASAQNIVDQKYIEAATGFPISKAERAFAKDFWMGGKVYGLAEYKDTEFSKILQSIDPVKLSPAKGVRELRFILGENYSEYEGLFYKMSVESVEGRYGGICVCQSLGLAIFWVYYPGMDGGQTPPGTNR